MADDSESGRRTEEFLDAVEPDDVHDADRLRPTPAQHERLKEHLFGTRFHDVRLADRRYLVVGKGGDGGPGERRREVCELLDDRRAAVAFRLEEFDLTNDEIELWAPAFEILAEMASHVVGVLEDFEGGHVWELGVLYRRQTTVRDALWLLKRVYETEEAMRDHYDNGMAASHVAALEDAAGERVITWDDPDDLSAAVAEIP